MGLFSAVWNRQNNQATTSTQPSPTQPYTLQAPVNGILITPENIDDPTFSEQILGPTTAFVLEASHECTVCSPCDGEVTQIFKTAHAVTLLASGSQAELLIHVGINTVDLKGEGFEAAVHEGQMIKAGDPLLRFDGKFLESQGYELVVPMTICNAYNFADIKFIDPQDVKVGDVICKLEPNT